MTYHLREKSKSKVSLREFKSEASLEENCKCSLEQINPTIKLEGLVWKPWYSGTSSLGLKLKESIYRPGLSRTTINWSLQSLFSNLFIYCPLLFLLYNCLYCHLHSLSLNF